MLFSSRAPSGSRLASFYIYKSTVNTISFTNLNTSSFWRSNSRRTFCLNAQNSFLSSVITTAESLFSAERLDCCIPRERVGSLTREVFFSSPSTDPFFSYRSSFFLLSSLASLHLKESCVWFSGWISVDECMRDREELKSLSTDWDRSREGSNFDGKSLLGVRKAVSRWVGLLISLHLQCLSLIDSYKLFQPITAPFSPTLLLLVGNQKCQLHAWVLLRSHCCFQFLQTFLGEDCFFSIQLFELFVGDVVGLLLDANQHFPDLHSQQLVLLLIISLFLFLWFVVCFEAAFVLQHLLVIFIVLPGLLQSTVLL